MPKIFDTLLGVAPFDCIPNYLYAHPNSSPPDAIVLTGVIATEVLFMSASIYSVTYIAANLVRHLTNAITAGIYSQTYIAAHLIGHATNAMTAGIYSQTYIAAPLTTP